jgi:hypothetical protein
MSLSEAVDWSHRSSLRSSAGWSRPLPSRAPRAESSRTWCHHRLPPALPSQATPPPAPASCKRWSKRRRRAKCRSRPSKSSQGTCAGARRGTAREPMIVSFYSNYSKQSSLPRKDLNVGITDDAHAGLCADQRTRMTNEPCAGQDLPRACHLDGRSPTSSAPDSKRCATDRSLLLGVVHCREWKAFHKRCPQ